jgi:TonB family protein
VYLEISKRWVRTWLPALVVLVVCNAAYAADDVLPKVVKKVAPYFPEDAAKRGIKSGVIVVHLTVDGDGKVTAVNVLNSEPPKLFDKDVTSALSKWQFEANGKVSNGNLKIVLQSED